VPVTRTVGIDRIVDELIHKFTHTIEMPWMLPGIRPTGKRVEVAVVVVVQFKDGKIAGEHIYWDQASVLAQIGSIDSGKLPASGIEASRKVIDASKEPSNSLIRRWVDKMGSEHFSERPEEDPRPCPATTSHECSSVCLPLG
jgi:carboxymethylenebutenolidase